MKSRRALATALLFTLIPAALATDWPAWRGPARDGHAAADQRAPIKWSETENVLWRTPVRGRGHGSPTVVGNRIYLATADHATQEQLVLALDRATGREVWATVVHRGGLETGGHRNSSQASASVVWDGDRLLINFLNAKAIHTTALDPAGKILWQTRVDSYVPHQGFGASPVVHESLVLVAADHRGGGKLAALDRRTGQLVWEHARPKIANYASPAIITAAGRTQVVLGGCNLLVSLDPLTGKKLWEVEGSTEETVVTAVTDGHRVFTSGGYPRSHVVAVEADGSGKIAWQNPTRAYVPSMLVRAGHLYAVLDAGQAVCWRSDTGEELWREKVDKDFYASPVMLGSRIYATSLRGVTSVFEATPQKFTLLAQNQLGDEALATPAICGGRIYLRAAKKGETREEFLWCIGEK
ncbi:MAG: PQQ-binding-like beta-propeller repeat protein [Opitutaceae bacterium]|nr:PQQ-binding-like beta-propeller repeat protein [Opitutaceae bacterium]